MVNFEKEVCEYLHIPSIPKKKFDGTTSFEKGVAIIKLIDGLEAYAIATFNKEKDEQPRILKVFSITTFDTRKEIFIVPNYMDTNIKDADLDEEAKKKAQEIVEEAQEIENENTQDELDIDLTNEWVFDEIHNADEARAWLSAYNERNGIKGRLPQKEETLKLRLLAIKTETDNKNK